MEHYGVIFYDEKKSHALFMHSSFLAEILILAAVLVVVGAVRRTVLLAVLGRILRIILGVLILGILILRILILTLVIFVL